MPKKKFRPIGRFMNVQNLNNRIFIQSDINLNSHAKRPLGIERLKKTFFGFVILKFQQKTVNFNLFQYIYDLCLPIITFLGKLLTGLVIIGKLLHKYCAIKVGSLVKLALNCFNYTHNEYYNIVVGDPKQLPEVLDVLHSKGLKPIVTNEYSVFTVSH